LTFADKFLGSKKALATETSDIKESLAYMSYIADLQRIQNLLQSGNSNMYVNMIIGDIGGAFQSKNPPRSIESQDRQENKCSMNCLSSSKHINTYNIDQTYEYASKKMKSSYHSKLDKSVVMKNNSRQGRHYLYGYENSDSQLYLVQGIANADVGDPHQHQAGTVNSDSNDVPLKGNKNTDGKLHTHPSHENSKNNLFKWQFQALAEGLAQSLAEKSSSDKLKVAFSDSLSKLSAGASHYNSPRINQGQVHCFHLILCAVHTIDFFVLWILKYFTDANPDLARSLPNWICI